MKRNYKMSYFINCFIDIILIFLKYILKKCNNSYLDKLKRFLVGIKAEVIYVVEDEGWAIEWVGKYITRNLKKLNLIKAEITKPQILKKKIIHYGSINCLINNNTLIQKHRSNKIVLTWFHISPKDDRVKLIPLINRYVDIVHTSCEITARKLKQYGFDDEKIIVIPLGVDNSHFKSYDKEKKDKLREKYKIPKNKIIIGSFQKDGIGWGEGLEPKLIKGPDILYKVLKKLNKEFDIHVFLTGPARGYIKNKLKEFNIPFTHIFLENYLDIVECYNILDLYLVTSRAEGGPQALLEAMATGIPIVTTNVGMAPNLIKTNSNGLIAEVENIEEIFQYSKIILTDANLRQLLIKNGQKTIKNYSWEYIAKEYSTKIYYKIRDR
jgi:glycosyltransferase involved in cell wall biosynthesis